MRFLSHLTDFGRQGLDPIPLLDLNRHKFFLLSIRVSNYGRRSIIQIADNTALKKEHFERRIIYPPKGLCKISNTLTEGYPGPSNLLQALKP